jgi:hypothetical protein
MWTVRDLQEILDQEDDATIIGVDGKMFAGVIEHGTCECCGEAMLSFSSHDSMVDRGLAEKIPDDLCLCPKGGQHDTLGPVWTFPETHAGGATCSKCGGWPVNGLFAEQPPTAGPKE